MSRVEVELQKSVRIRTMYKSHDGCEHVARTKAYTNAHHAAKAYAQSSSWAWAMRSRTPTLGSLAFEQRKRKVYAKVRPIFDKMLDT